MKGTIEWKEKKNQRRVTINSFKIQLTQTVDLVSQPQLSSQSLPQSQVQIIEKQPMKNNKMIFSQKRGKKIQKYQSQVMKKDQNQPQNYSEYDNIKKKISKYFKDNQQIQINNKNKLNGSFNNQEHQLKFQNIELLKKDPHKFLSWIRENIVGFNTTYTSAVGLEIESVYVDHTATNRPFKLVELLVEHAKLFAANPHTEFSRYGKFATQLMHYARDSLLKSFSAPQNQFIVLPAGAGSTGAIQKTIRFLQRMSDSNPEWKNPTIFLTPYQHHSNILPWVQFYEKSEIQILAHNKIGTLDFQRITQRLRQCSSKNIILSVSAASNVTSKLTNLKELNDIIKEVRQQTSKSIVFCVDCAAFCCHHDLNLKIYDQIDFAFLSPHKNLGGAQSCGILLGRKSLMSCTRPTFPGGGTVNFVRGYSKNDVMYVTDIFSKEIAGTPPYLGFYRAALSFQLLKNVIGYDFIHERQKRNTQLFFQKINAANAEMKAQGIDTYINLYGERDLSQRANVISFNYIYQVSKENEYIQHSFSSLLLNDLFGLQVRSGCFCAGPFGIRLLQLNYQKIQKIIEEVEADVKISKPGYLRLDLSFYFQDYQIEYIANAITLVARYWRNLQKLYTVCNDGEVILLPIFNKYKKRDIYSLHQVEDAYSKLTEQKATHMNKIENRRKTLERQLKKGQLICQKPFQYIKQIKH